MHLDADALRRELAIRGLTQRELALVAGLTEATVSRCLNGHMANYTTIRKLARALTVTPVMAGAENIVGSQKDAAYEVPLMAANAGGLSNATSTI